MIKKSQPDACQIRQVVIIIGVGIVNMQKRFITLLILLAGFASCNNSIHENSDSGTIGSSDAKLDSLGQTILQTGELLGFSVAIMQGEDTVYNRGFGFMDVARTRPVTHRTRFKIASVSKLMGSTLVMKLVEEGKLSLDQTLGELLPDFPNPGQASAITLEHMISHTSGLADYAAEIDTVYVRTGKAPTKEDYYSFFRGRDLLFEPGTNYSYCNSGFLLMGMIVERVTDHSLQQEFDRTINEPSGMDLKLIAAATSLPSMSPYWEKKDSAFIPYPHWSWIKGDGGLTATSIMLAQFPRQWASGKLISQSSFVEMVTPRILTDGIPSGYGIGVPNGAFFGERIIGHTGGHKSTYAIMAYFPERELTAVVLANTDNTPTDARKIFGLFAAEYLGYDASTLANHEQTPLIL